MGTQWSERQLEDWLVNDPTMILDAALGRGHDRSKVRLLGRQVRCRTGIMDLLISHDATLFIVELKAVKATEETIGQVTRYRENILHTIGSGIIKYATDDQCERFAYTDGPDSKDVMCIIIAPSFTPQAVNTCAFIGFPIQVSTDSYGNFYLDPADFSLSSRDENENLDSILKDFYLDYLRITEARLARIAEYKLNEVWGSEGTGDHG